MDFYELDLMIDENFLGSLQQGYQQSYQQASQQPQNNGQSFEKFKSIVLPAIQKAGGVAQMLSSKPGFLCH